MNGRYAVGAGSGPWAYKYSRVAASASQLATNAIWCETRVNSVEVRVVRRKGVALGSRNSVRLVPRSTEEVVCGCLVDSVAVGWTECSREV
jgi:hypothetical protein